MSRICFIFLSLLSLSAPADETASAPSVKLGPTGLALRDWCQLGPFQADLGETSVERDFLEIAGVREAVLTVSQFQALCAKPSVLPVNVIQTDDEEGRVNFFNVPGIPDTAVYLGSEIIADQEANAWLMLNHYSDHRVWLNGRLIHVCGEPSALEAYEKSIAVSLERGGNLLLIKLGKVNRYTSMAARLEPTRASVTREALKRADTLVKHLMVLPTQPLNIALPGVPDSVELTGELQTHSGASVRAVDARPGTAIDISKLARGLYRLVITAYGGRAQQAFYIGTSAEALADLQMRSEPLMSDERVTNNLQTLIRRLRATDRPPEMRQANQTEREEVVQMYAEKNAVDAIVELTDTLDVLERKAEAFRDRPGLHLRGFRSRIDDQVQHYRLFVPSSYRTEGSGLPLVIVPVTPFAREQPFIESVFLQSRSSTDPWIRTAEALGLGILWPGYRVRPYGNPLDMAHVDEVLAAVAMDYRIDTRRLYLYGDCGSGLTVSMQAVRHPSRYAAIVYHNPVLHRVKNRYDETSENVQHPAYQQWLRDTDPVEALASLRDLPIWIQHDGIDPLGGPLSHSVDFVQRARAAGNRPIFEHKRTDEQHDWFNLPEKQLTWLASHRNPRPTELNIAREPASGPLSRVFAERFIVVKGTQGSEAERQAAESWYRGFCDAWQRTNYGPCRAVSDVALSVTEEATSNLVLIGNVRTNAIWARLADQLPVELSPTSISIKGENWTGDRLALQAWFPHPQIHGRKVALIGSADLEHAQVGTMELALDGWFDFAIWSMGADKPELHHAGRYEPEDHSTQYQSRRSTE